MNLPASPLAKAHWLAFLVPAGLLGGAYVGEYFFDLYPCEMCWWQRYAHFAALALASVAAFVPPRRLAVTLAGLAILVGGLIGAFHAGVEYGWWEGFTTCSSLDLGSSEDPFEALMNAPLVRCDDVQWALFGVSLAGWNFLISTAAAIVIFNLLRKKAG